MSKTMSSDISTSILIQHVHQSRDTYHFRIFHCSGQTAHTTLKALTISYPSCDPTSFFFRGHKSKLMQKLHRDWSHIMSCGTNNPENFRTYPSRCLSLVLFLREWRTQDTNVNAGKYCILCHALLRWLKKSPSVCMQLARRICPTVV